MFVVLIVLGLIAHFWVKRLANKQSIECVSKRRFFWKLFGRIFLRLSLLVIGLCLPVACQMHNSELGGELLGMVWGNVFFLSPYLLWVAWRETTRRYAPAPEA